MDDNPYESPKGEPLPPREPSPLGVIAVVVLVGLAVLGTILLVGALCDNSPIP
jgi:hypothetical protein